MDVSPGPTVLYHFNTVIKGWMKVIDMSIGEVAKIHCSPDYAYGAGGFPVYVKLKT
jgi:FKBP-type peptidyl-prolyl cis-trans isomerase